MAYGIVVWTTFLLLFGHLQGITTCTTNSDCIDTAYCNNNGACSVVDCSQICGSNDFAYVTNHSCRCDNCAKQAVGDLPCTTALTTTLCRPCASTLCTDPMYLSEIGSYSCVSGTCSYTLHTCNPYAQRCSNLPDCTIAPTNAPTGTPITEAPTTLSPTVTPTNIPTKAPSNAPTTPSPTNQPTNVPTSQPTTLPTPLPTTSTPTVNPTNIPTKVPSSAPTTPSPTFAPTNVPTTLSPTSQPTTSNPTPLPTPIPTTSNPTNLPTKAPSNTPTTNSPTFIPTIAPTLSPTNLPTSNSPTLSPTTTEAPTSQPTGNPTVSPTILLTAQPTPILSTVPPTIMPTCAPNTGAPTNQPSTAPTTLIPTEAPTRQPTSLPTATEAPTHQPTTLVPTESPTRQPTTIISSNTTCIYCTFTQGGYRGKCNSKREMLRSCSDLINSLPDGENDDDDLIIPSAACIRDKCFLSPIVLGNSSLPGAKTVTLTSSVAIINFLSYGRGTPGVFTTTQINPSSGLTSGAGDLGNQLLAAMLNQRFFMASTSLEALFFSTCCRSIDPILQSLSVSTVIYIANQVISNSPNTNTTLYTSSRFKPASLNDALRLYNEAFGRCRDTSKGSTCFKCGQELDLSDEFENIIDITLPSPPDSDDDEVVLNDLLHYISWSSIVTIILFILILLAILYFTGRLNGRNPSKTRRGK